MVGRAIIVAVGALLLALLVVRNAFVEAYGTRNPTMAASVWPGHPSVVLTSGLEEVGTAAAAAQPVNPATVRQMLAISAKAPTAPEPFLVRGVEAMVAGDQAMAHRAFLEARRRDPRSVAARYFLANHYLQVGQTRPGLAEIVALTRLVPVSLDPIAPYLAAFARSPGGAEEVREVLRDQPNLEPVLLNVLAADPRDSQLALSLWSGRTGDRDKGWQARLVETLVNAGQYRQARAVWGRFNPGTNPTGLLVDPRFQTGAGPPFGWSLASGSSGVAEPEGDGRLHILFYGRDNVALANQLVTLAPGPYRLSMRIGGASTTAESLAWRVSCLAPPSELATIGLNSTRGGQLIMDFVVPAAGCEVQRLVLAGTAPDVPEQVDLTISELSLVARAQ